MMELHLRRQLAETCGKGSHIGRLDDHPVVQIAYRETEAYAGRVGKALPTEAECEFAALSEER